MGKSYPRPPPPAIAWSYPNYSSSNYRQPHVEHLVHPLDSQPGFYSTTDDAAIFLPSPSAAASSADDSNSQAPVPSHHRRNAARPVDIPARPRWPPSPSQTSYLATSRAPQQERRPATCPADAALPFLSSSDFTVGSIPEPPAPWPVQMQSMQTPVDEKNDSTPGASLNLDEGETLLFKIEDIKM